MQILIDGKVVGEAQPSGRTSTYQVVFTSDYYPYGEHTILIKHIGNDYKTFFINSFLVDPLPRVGGHKLGFTDILNNNGWTLNNSLRTPFFQSSSRDHLNIFLLLGFVHLKKISNKILFQKLILF